MNEQSDSGKTQTVTVVGAGLVGSLLSIFLTRHGFAVDLFERRSDMRKHAISAGRSINLAISNRGIHALSLLELDKEILPQSIPMKGRMIHARDGELTFQAYGKDESEYINSISRATLNKALMTYAENSGKVKISFNQKITGMDFDKRLLHVFDEESKKTYDKKIDVVIGTDGSASAIRADMMRLDSYSTSEETLSHGYKELLIPVNQDGSFALEKNALHIWPRGSYMLIALPNFEGSFTVTLFLPFKGPLSFESLQNPSDVKKFFQEEFPDAYQLIPNLEEAFFANPTGHMVTVKSNRWHVDGSTLLMGDAAHGIVPFFGQGMNCGFEDCTIFHQLLEEAGGDPNWSQLFARFTELRRTNTDAIADMAVENFTEMRDKVADPQFLLQKQVESILQKQFPGKYISRYSLVTFSLVPYRQAYESGLAQQDILQELCAGLSRAEDVDLAKAEKLISVRLNSRASVT